MRQTVKLSARLFLGVWGLLIGVGAVFAFVLNGQDWNQHANPMGEDYVVCENTSDTTGENAAVMNAAATWNSVPATFSFTSGGTACNPAPVFDDINQIRWGSTSGSLATTTWWSNANDEILEADCVFNDSFTWSTAANTPAGEHDVESVMLHEFGHYLSLSHSTPPAIMQPSIPSGTQRRTLQTDDCNGIRAIYGGGTGCGGGGGGCSTVGLSAAVVSPSASQLAVNFLLLFSPMLLVGIARLFLWKA